MNRKYWFKPELPGLLSMMDLRSLLDYKALHRNIGVRFMAGASQRYKYIAILAATTLLLTSGCMKREQLTVSSEQLAAVPPPQPPPTPVAAKPPSDKAKTLGKRAPSRKKAAAAISGIFAAQKTRGLVLAKPGIPSYPVWPPEAPSSRVSLDRFIQARTNLSLYDAGQKLKRSFEQAGYLEYGYYAAPGGFVLVTRIEKISAKGDRLPGTERYKLPSERSSGSLTSFVRGLFLDAPPGFYRYIAVVVSDKPYQTSRKPLSSKQAEIRLTRGSNNLSSVYKEVPFTKDYNVDALIYEFTKNTRTGKVRMIAPGRLTPSIHLTKTKLKKTIASNFGR